jgi:hypothetical protein
MTTTTVIWTQEGQDENPTAEQRIALSAMAMSLSGVDNPLITVDPSGSKIATREWPTTEIAQAWVDYVLANYVGVSAVIDPE